MHIINELTFNQHFLLRPPTLSYWLVICKGSGLLSIYLRRFLSIWSFAGRQKHEKTPKSFIVEIPNGSGCSQQNVPITPIPWSKSSSPPLQTNGSWEISHWYTKVPIENTENTCLGYVKWLFVGESRFPKGLFRRAVFFKNDRKQLSFLKRGPL